MSDSQLSILDTRFMLAIMGSMQEFAHLLRSEMERQGIEGQQIADTLGIGQSMVSDIVNAKKKNPPSQDVFKGIGRVLGIPQERMLIALGYLDPPNADAEERPAPESIASVLRDIEWTPQTTQLVANQLHFIRDAQRGTYDVSDPREADRDWDPGSR